MGTQGITFSQQEEVLFLQQAVRINTVSHRGDELALARLLSNRMQAAGFKCQTFKLDGNRCNFIASLSSGRPGPRIVFTGHMDTVPEGNVPWKHDPFAAVIENDILYGRGSVDMKSGLVASMFAMLRFASKENNNWSGEIILAATSCEETGAEGAQTMVDQSQLGPFDGLIVAEPTDNNLVVAHKGALWTAIESKGKSAHSSMPNHGINAIDHLLSFYQRMGELDVSAPEHGLLDGPTKVVTMLTGGTQNNVVPDYSRLVFDIRSLPNQSHEALIQQINNICANIMQESNQAQLSSKVLLNIPAVSTKPDALLVQIAKQVLSDLKGHEIKEKGARYFTDASVLQQLGKEIIVLGPGDPIQAHQTNEHLVLADYMQAIDIYEQILRRRMLV